MYFLISNYTNCRYWLFLLLSLIKGTSNVENQFPTIGHDEVSLFWEIA